MDNYVELYKELRPKVWEDVIGQKNITNSLKSNIKSNKLPSAYLFAGPSGSGKTTSALILAKAVNCLQPLPNGDPCNTCEVCEAIDDGSQIGVSYFSAAQKSGVDEMREIVEKSSMKVPIKKQIFIIDEIHNASNKAFEALLIPLEDTKMNSMFIFCTTEIEKVPPTLLSRFPTLKFNKIDAETMTEYLSEVNEMKDLGLTQETVLEAVRKGRGNVRSSLNFLETIRYSENQMEETDFGSQLLLAIASKKIDNMFAVISEASNNGVSIRDLSEQLFEDLRNLLLYQAGVSEELIGVIPVDNPERVIKGMLGSRGILLITEELGEAITQMSRGNDYRISLEIALVKSLEKLRKLYKSLMERRKNE